MMGCSAAIAAMAGSQLTQVAVGADGPGETLVVVFLRGGWDVLSVLPPIDGPDRGFYEAARNTLKIPTKGEGAALGLNGQLGLHPAMRPLFELYQGKRLAIVQATGMPSDTRSHFDAMEYLELGTPGSSTTPSGWLTRHLQQANTTALLAPGLSLDANLATSLRGSLQALALTDPADFGLSNDDEYRRVLSGVLAKFYSGDNWLHQAGRQTLSALASIEKAGFKGEYKPKVTYPETDFARSLKHVARMIKQDIGLRAATVDLGGWDTHQYQGDGSGGYFADLLTQLSGGMAAFYADLDQTGHSKRTTVVVMSEFGRRLSQNASYGTDHGHASAMLVLGGGVNGGRLYGKWPGLAPEQLYDRADLAVTTDYRQVLAELLVKRHGNSKMDVVFPGFKAGAWMGLV
jgi:uncharacterized protein (DUF1501 family)